MDIYNKTGRQGILTNIKIQIGKDKSQIVTQLASTCSQNKVPHWRETAGKKIKLSKTERKKREDSGNSGKGKNNKNLQSKFLKKHYIKTIEDRAL